MPSWRTCLRVGTSAFALFLCIRYWDVLGGFIGLAIAAAFPIFLGCALAFILNIPMRFFERHYYPGDTRPFIQKSRRVVCLAMALCCVAALVALLLILVVPELINCVSLIVARVPDTLTQLGNALSQAEWLAPEIAAYLVGINWQDLVNHIIGAVWTGFGSVANLAAGVITSVISVTVNAVMAFILAIYILLSKERLGRQFKELARRYVKKSWHETISHVADVLEDCFRSYIVGQCTEAVILGALCAAGMVIFRFPYAAVVGATVGFTALIPVVGTYIGGAVGFLLILTVSPVQAVFFLVYLVCLQQFEGNVIYPKVAGRAMGLPPVWILCTVIIGGGVWGILGILLGIPLATAAYRLIREDVRRDRPEKPGGWQS